MGFLDTNSPTFVSFSKNTEKNNEPISVLDTRWSPSPSTSASTISGGLSGELPPPLTAAPAPPTAALDVSGDEWEALLSDPFILRWIDTCRIPNEINPEPQNPYPQIPNLCPQISNFPIFPNETLDEKPQSLAPFPPNFGPFADSGNVISNPQVPNFDKDPPFAQTLAPPYADATPLKRQNLGNLDLDLRFSGLYKQPPETLALVPQQVVYDQLYKAAELILSGNLANAHSILARLNHQLTPGTMPFQRASFFLKEALLQLPLLGPGSGSPNLLSKSPTPIDGLFRMGAYKLLSEVSPLTNFVNFTSNQAILEAVGDSERVHVIDFDIGSGAQWASFMAELPILGRTKGTPCLKITGFASPLTHHPFELGLMHENLIQIANDIGINFELEVVNLDAFDSNAYPVHLFKLHDKETTLAVNFPIWAFSNRLAMLPSLIRFVKQLSPKIVVSMEHGCERSDLSFPNHLLHALQYHEALLQSIDAANTNSETISKIEKFLVQPRIENIVLGRLGYPNQMPHWRALFAAAGFSQVNISNFAEIQAECVLNKTQVRGFHVERRQSSLVLSWQRRELVSASAWRC